MRPGTRNSHSPYKEGDRDVQSCDHVLCTWKTSTVVPGSQKPILSPVHSAYGCAEKKDMGEGIPKNDSQEESRKHTDLKKKKKPPRFSGLLLLSQKRKKIIKEAEKYLAPLSLENVSRKDSHVQPTQSVEEMKPPGVGEASASHVCEHL